MSVSPEQYTGPKEFVHLHNHTVFSSLDGVSTPEQYAEQCKERGYPAMSATEHGHMGSVPDMYLAFKKFGVQYIPGCEIYYNDWEPKRQELVERGVKVRSIDWRNQNIEEASRISRNRHLTVLCKNETGFNNLLKLTTQAYDTGLFGLGRTQFNRIWFEKLCEYKEGLIILSGCLNGPVCHELHWKNVVDREGVIQRERPFKERIKEAVKYVKKFRAVFGEDYFMELQMPGIDEIEDQLIFRQLIQIADELGIKLVLCNDCHYLRRKDFQLQKVMMAVAQETTIHDPNLFHVNSSEQYMKSRAELWARFKNNSYSNGIPDSVFEEMCDNTLLIADRCEPLQVDATPKIPKIDDADNQLRREVALRLKELGLDKCTDRYVVDGKEVTYVDQAKIELKRFIDKGFASYFLITQDLIGFGKKRGWPFSPRGSAGGSLVCFLLGIHVLDPLKWELSFDRFLSPSRGGYMLNVKMPEPVN